MQGAPAFSWRIQRSLVEVGMGLLIALVAIAIHWKILLDGAPINSHDLTVHVTWLHHFAQQVMAGEVYPRWLAGTNYGYGSPTFVFYPPLVYYVGTGLQAAGLTIDQTVAALFGLASWGAGLSVYWFGRSQWGMLPGLAAALAYMANPYMVYNIYTRGAIAELWALIWVPLGFWTTLQALKSPRWRIGPPVIFCLLALTHLPSLLLYLICWAVYLLGLLVIGQDRRVLPVAALSLPGLGLAAFFLLPALIEKSQVNVQSMQTVMGGFSANFVGTALEYLYTNPFLLTIQTIFIQSSLMAVAVGAIALICYRQQPCRIREAWVWMGLIVSIAWLMSEWSKPIWQTIPTLQALQFPWRLLGFYWFSIAALSGLALRGVLRDARIPMKLVGSVLLITLIGLATNHIYQQHSLSTLHQPGEVKLATHERLRLRGGEASERKLLQRIKLREGHRLQMMRTVFYQPFADNLLDRPEYQSLLPGDRPVPPPQMGQPQITVVQGQATVEVLQWRSTHRQIEISGQTATRIRLRTYAFPAWNLTVNGVDTPIQMAEDGTIEVGLLAGSSHVILNYGITPAFKVGIGISLLSLAVLAWIGLPHPAKSVSRLPENAQP